MKQILIILASAAFLALGSCHTDSANKSKITFSQNTEVINNYVAGIDLSDSRDKKIINWYINVIMNSIVGKMGKDDKLVVIPIDYGSLTASEEIFACDFSKNNYSNDYNGLQAEEAETKAHKAAVKVAKTLCQNRLDSVINARKEFANGTDLIGAFIQASNYKVPEGNNFLIVLSDMLLCTDKNLNNFEKNVNDSNDVKKFVNKMLKVDFTGWTVIIVTGEQQHITPERYLLIRSLWERWFKVCHGDVKVYTSGAVCLLENELKQ